MDTNNSLSSMLGKIVAKIVKLVIFAVVLAASIRLGLSWSLHECGMCGARTFEMWYAGPDCPVCSKCYDELRYND